MKIDPITGIRTFVKLSVMPEVDKKEETSVDKEPKEEPKEPENQLKEDEKEPQETEEEHEECKEEPKIVVSEDNFETKIDPLTGIRIFVKSSVTPEVENKEEKSVEKEQEIDKTELSGTEKDTQNDNNGQGCDTKDEIASVEPQKTEVNVEENKDETENNSAETETETDKKDDDATEDKNENVLSDGQSDENKTVQEIKTTEVENKGKDESTSMEQIHVDGQSDKKTNVDEGKRCKR